MLEEIIEQFYQDRVRQRLTQSQVDERAGLPKNTTHKVEKGQIVNARIFEKVAKALGGTIIYRGAL